MDAPCSPLVYFRAARCAPTVACRGRGGTRVTKHWTNFTLIAMGLAVTATTAFACDGHAPTAEAKEAPGTAVAAPVGAVAVTTGDAKGCDMPCCAHAKEAADLKAAAPVKAEVPCAAHEAKGCPKKATAANAVAKADPAKGEPQTAPAAESPKPIPATDPGTQR